MFDCRFAGEDNVDLPGDFYRIHDFTLKPKPLNSPDRPNPELFQGGNSTAARRNGGYYADWYFSNGKDFDGSPNRSSRCGWG